MSSTNFLLILLINIVLADDQYFINIKGTEYQFEFASTEAANQIKAKLPLNVQMTNLNENEVYYQFPSDSFTTNTKSVGTINMGDIYLYQNNCLVLFYKTFQPRYSYTELGKLKNPSGLDELIGSNDVEVQWYIKNPEKEADTTSSSTQEKEENNPKDSYDSLDPTQKATYPDDLTDDVHKFSIHGNIKLNYLVWLFFALIIC